MKNEDQSLNKEKREKAVWQTKFFVVWLCPRDFSFVHSIIHICYHSYVVCLKPNVLIRVTIFAEITFVACWEKLYIWFRGIALMAAVQTSGKSGILYHLFGYCVMLHENHVFIKKKLWWYRLRNQKILKLSPKNLL